MPNVVAVAMRRLSVATMFALLALQSANAATQQLKVASTLKEIIDNLPFFVGNDKGIFKQHDLELELLHFNGGGEVVRAVSGGAAEIGMVSTSAAIIAAARGEPLKLVSAWTAPAYAIVFIVPKGSPIETARDLEGKRVGFTRPGSVSHTGLTAAMQTLGIKSNPIPVGPAGDGWAMVKAGRIDATWHTAPDVYSLVDRGEARILFDISEYLKNYQQGALVTTSSIIAKDGAKLKRFIEASREIDAFIAARPDEAAAIYSKATGVAELRVKEMIKSAPDHFFQIGPIGEKNFSGSLAEAEAAGNLKQLPTYEAIVDISLLPPR